MRCERERGAAAHLLGGLLATFNGSALVVQCSGVLCLSFLQRRIRLSSVQVFVIRVWGC